MKGYSYHTLLNAIENTNDECESILNSKTDSERAMQVTKYATDGISSLYKLFDILRSQSRECDAISKISQEYIDEHEYGELASEISDMEFDTLTTAHNQLISYQDAIEEAEADLDDILDRLESLVKWFGI